MSATRSATDAGPSSAADAGSRRGTRLVMAWLAGLALVIVVIVVLVPPTPPPYATTSTAPDGTDILRRVLDDLGVEVVEGPAEVVLADLHPDDVAVLFVDRLGDAEEAVLVDHRATGGDLVVADPRSALADPADLSPAQPGLAVVRGRGVSGPPGCDLLPERMEVALTVDGFSGVGPGAVPDLVEAPAEGLPAGTTTCFATDGAALVVAFDDAAAGSPSAGTTTVVADADVLTNAATMAQPVLGQFANLFVPDEPAGRVVVVVGDQPPPVGEGVPGEPPARLVEALWLGGLALAIYGLARARRHGRLLAEDPPVEVPASELSMGIAELLQRHGEVGSAAARLRADLRAEVGPRVASSGAGGTPAVDVTDNDLARAVVAATGLDATTVDRAVADLPVHSGDDLVDVAVAIREVRAALLDTT